jgi:hypothetical protein
MFYVTPAPRTSAQRPAFWARTSKKFRSLQLYFVPRHEALSRLLFVRPACENGQGFLFYRSCFIRRIVFFNSKQENLMHSKILIIAVLVAAGLAPPVLAANTLTTDLRSGTLKAGKVVSATVSKVYGDIKDADSIIGKPISNGVIQSVACSDTQALTGKVSGGIVAGLVLGAKVNSEITVEQNSATLKDEQKDLTLHSSSVTCLQLAVKDLKINDVVPPGGFKGKDGKVRDTIQVDLVNAEISDATLANTEISAENLRPKQASTITPDNGDSFQGDYLELQASTPNFISKRTGAVITAPPHACFRVNRDTGKDEPKDAKLYGTFVGKQDIFWLKQLFIDGMIGDCSDVGKDRHKADLDTTSVTSQYRDIQHEEYVIDKSELIDHYDYVRYGFTYGVMATPFKYYPGKGVLESRSTIGGYLGYRLHDRPGISNVIAVAVGPTTATLNTTAANGTNTTGTANGTTIALAWLGQFKSEFTTGVIVGWDFFSNTDNVPNNGSVWIGLTLGYKVD